MALIERFKRAHALAKVSAHSKRLAKELEGYPLHTIQLTNELFSQYTKGGSGPAYFAEKLRDGIRSKAFDRENLPQILSLLKENKRSGGGTDDLALALRAGLQEKLFNAENMPQIMPLLHQAARKGHGAHSLAVTLRTALKDWTFSSENLPQILTALKQAADEGHDPSYLAWKLRTVMEKKKISAEKNPEVLELALRHVAKGKDPSALAAVLQTAHLPPTEKNLQALKEAEPHILRAYDFLHGIEKWEDHWSVSAPLFAHVLKTYKTELPKMGEKAYWKWIGLHAKELKANKTNLKPA